MLEDLDLHSIADERARALVRQLLNLLEDVMADLRAAQAENQRLRDEINRLKGEQGQPTIKPNTPQPPPKNQGHSVLQLGRETCVVSLGARASGPLRKQARRLRSQDHTRLTAKN